jgi:predicted metal-binding protein
MTEKADVGAPEAQKDGASARSLLVEKARELGADAAVLLSARDVVIDERVRLKCAVPVCQGYGNYLHCPPNTFSVAEFREILARFDTALLVQVESPRNSLDIDDEGLANKNAAELEDLLHGDSNRRLLSLIGRLEAEAFKAGFYYATGLAGGICLLCPDCVRVASGEPCRHPYEARPSMEGVGIDVYRTAANAGLPIALSADEPVRWTGIVLVD